MAFDISTLLSSELHDIKNQMQSLMDAQTELSERLKGQPDYQQSLHAIWRHSHSLNQKLVELLSVLKIQHTEFSPNIDEYWLCDTLAEVVQELGLGPKDARIMLDFDYEFNGFYDEQLISIAVHNALVNAMKAGAQRISIQVEEHEDGSFTILILDDGPGFPEAYLDRTEFKSHGTSGGLGLYLMEQALQAHGHNSHKGAIQLSNRPEGGACVKLLVP